MRPAWAAFAQGCQCNRPLLNLIGSSFVVQAVTHEAWNGMPALVRPLVIGRAGAARN